LAQLIGLTKKQAARKQSTMKCLSTFSRKDASANCLRMLLLLLWLQAETSNSNCISQHQSREINSLASRMVIVVIIAVVAVDVYRTASLISIHAAISQQPAKQQQKSVL